MACGAYIYMVIISELPFTHGKEFPEDVRSPSQTMSQEGCQYQDSCRHNGRQFLGNHAHAKQRRNQVDWREKLKVLANIMIAI